jgi:serine phosphatase RsbU (regulator of sigma subunit)
MKRIILGWLAFAMLSSSAPIMAIEVTPATPLQFIDKETLVLKDQGWTAQQASERIADFTAPPSAADVRINDTYWLLNRLHSGLDTDYTLRIDLLIWDKVQPYAVRADGKIEALHAIGGYSANYLSLGDVNPAVQTIGEAHSQFSTFTLHRGESLVILTRIRHAGNFQPQTFTPAFSDQIRMLELRRLGLHIEGVQIGILIALSLFGWFSVLMHRDRTSLAYGVWIIFAILSVTSLRVHDGQRLFEFYLPIEGIQLRYQTLSAVLTNVFAYCQSMCYVIFARNFLNLKEHMPRVYAASNVYIALTLVHLTLANFVDHQISQNMFWTPLFTMIMLMLLTIFRCAFVRYKQGLRVAKFFMFAMVPYLFFRSIFFLGLINVPSPFTMLEKTGVGLFLQSSTTAQAMGMCAEAIIMAFAVISRTRWLQEELSQRIEQENQRLEATVTERTRELEASKREVEAQHEIVVDSIRYASRLQKAQLPRLQRIAGYFESFQAIWEPRDTIGGDVWWASAPDDRGRITLAVADSTGHGVPGAMLSVLVSTSLEKIYAGNPSLDPASALMALDSSLRSALNQDSADAESDDGCDAAIVRIDPATREIEFAGAKLGLLHARADGSIARISPSRLSLGYRDSPHETPELHRILYERGDGFVIVSDGFTDQIGSREGPPRAYGYRRLHELLDRMKAKPAPDIAEAMRRDLLEWQGQQLRRDDVTAVVFKPA